MGPGLMAARLLPVLLPASVCETRQSCCVRATLYPCLQDATPAFDFSQQYLYQEQLYGLEGRPAAAALPSSKGEEGFSGTADEDAAPPHHGPQWALLRFSQPVTAPAVGLLTPRSCSLTAVMWHVCTPS